VRSVHLLGSGRSCSAVTGPSYDLFVGDITGEATELLQALIRNDCVDDATTGSGGGSRSADVREGFLEGPGLDSERYEAHPGRSNLVARSERSHPGTPSVIPT
jgi:hypothetical protein